MNFKCLLLGLAVTTIAPICARAADAGWPDYVQRAWRMRLVTLAPACKSRDAAWANSARQAIGRDEMLAIKAEDRDLALGAMAYAEHVGTWLAKNPSGPQCKFASATALANTDQLVSAPPGEPITPIDQTAQAYKAHNGPSEATTWAQIVSASQLCHMRGASWAQLAMSVTRDKAVADIKETSLRDAAFGAVVEAAYARMRMVADTGLDGCKVAPGDKEFIALEKAMKEKDPTPRLYFIPSANPDD